ncbi:MAG: diguanylate cyclase [Phycisphaerae bacterium]
MPHRALLIDDSDLIHKQIQFWLQQEAVEVSHAYSGQEGFEKCHSEEPSLVLLDVDMPGMNGFEVCQLLKDNPATMHIPVVFLTGATSIQQKIEGLDLGAIDYITKPIEPAEFRARIRAVLRLRFLMDLLSNKAQIDALTGLRNRGYLDERLVQLVALTRRNRDEVYSAILCDVDNFKILNDTYGHAAGDEVLRGVADALARTTRVEDILTRYGGEEFVVLTPTVGVQGAACLAERLRYSVESQSVRYAKHTLSVTASFGVAQVCPDNPEDLLVRADTALYRAKHAGRNCVRIDEAVGTFEGLDRCPILAG